MFPSIRLTVAARGLLVAVALWCVATGVAYMPQVGATPSVLGLVYAVIPPHAWAVLWITAGVLMLAGLRWYRARQIGTSLAMGLTLLLACAYSSAWLTGDMARGWVSAKNYILIAAVVSLGAAVLCEGVLAGGSTRRVP